MASRWLKRRKSGPEQGQLCLEIAQSCESRRRPKSSQAFYELAGKWLEVLPQRRSTPALANIDHHIIACIR